MQMIFFVTFGQHIFAGWIFFKRKSYTCIAKRTNLVEMFSDCQNKEKDKYSLTKTYMRPCVYASVICIRIQNMQVHFGLTRIHKIRDIRISNQQMHTSSVTMPPLVQSNTCHIYIYMCVLAKVYCTCVTVCVCICATFSSIKERKIHVDFHFDLRSLPAIPIELSVLLISLALSLAHSAFRYE